MKYRISVRHTGSEPEFKFKFRKFDNEFFFKEVSLGRSWGINISLPFSIFIAIRYKTPGEVKRPLFDLGMGREMLRNTRLRKKGYFRIRCTECYRASLNHSDSCSRDQNKLMFI